MRSSRSGSVASLGVQHRDNAGGVDCTHAADRVPRCPSSFSLQFGRLGGRDRDAREVREAINVVTEIVPLFFYRERKKITVQKRMQKNKS